MTIGGNLTVTNTGAYENFTVSFARNVTITNFRQREMGEVGDISATVKNGNMGETTRVYSNGKSGKLGTLDLNSKRYAIFDALRSLDGNKNDLSESDLKKADSLVGQNGVTGIKRDAKAGVTTILCDDGAVLKFDFETDTEMQARKQQEAINQQKKQAEADKKQAKERQEAIELHDNSRSQFEKVADWVCGKIDKLVGIILN